MRPDMRDRSADRGGAGAIDPGAVLIWDLDGTILDTKHDIATGVNEMLRAFGLHALPLERVLRHVGRGVRILVRRSLSEAGGGLLRESGAAEDFAEDVADDDPASEARIDAGVAVFREHYRRHMLDTTTPYEGVPALLDELTRRGRAMAVVSNKPEDATRSLVDAIGLAPCFRVVMGGDTLPVRKPAPETVLHALSVCRPEAAPHEAIVIGDSLTDLQTGRAAGMRVCGVGWGFDPDGDFRRTGADWWCDSVDELRALLLP